MRDRFGSTIDAQRLDPAAETSVELLILGPGGTRVLPTPDDGALEVGRHVDNDIFLEDPLVSRRHARLHFSGGVMCVEDLGGANGTRVAGASVEVGCVEAVPPGAPVQLGSTVLVWRTRVEPQLVMDGALVIDSKMRSVYEEAAGVARGRLSVLILGETGVGKDVLAHRIHSASPRASRPFVPVNCGALSGSLLESELFGYEQGAFTGADTEKPGLVEAAGGGTLFLDEVGELPASVQVKLLRVLANQEVLRVGGVATRSVDVRVVAATNRDLNAQVEAGLFRRDLFYRLAGATLEIPPLRARRSEIIPFARRFAEAAALQSELHPPRISDGVEARLLAHDWPGNLRELDNVMTRAVLLATRGEIEMKHLPEAPRTGSERILPVEKPEELGVTLEEPQLSERKAIEEALRLNAGNQTRAAASLGISRQTLSKKLDRYGIPRPRK